MLHYFPLSYCRTMPYLSAYTEEDELLKQTIALGTVSNARQLGGYPAADGKRIRDGLLLRSGALFNASQSDIDRLEKVYKLSAVIDLRTAEEAAEKPDPTINGASHYHIPVVNEGQDAPGQPAIVDIYRLYDDNPGRAYVEMVRAGALSEEMYTSLLDSKTALHAWRQFFDVLLSHKKGAILWHCTGGKDRAGLASVMVLSVLGVDKETILADFALTNEALRLNIANITVQASQYTSDPIELERAAALAGVYVPHMLKVFDRTESECGSILAFIQQRIGLTDEEVAKLRKMYLEEVNGGETNE